jgi:hypothetical protein
VHTAQAEAAAARRQDKRQVAAASDEQNRNAEAYPNVGISPDDQSKSRP